MSGLAIVGSQWGDEGKGKIIDYLAVKADMVVRAQGGNNAGHTVVFGNKKYALHLIPSGILNPDAINIIGNGIAFDAEGFFEEIQGLRADGISTDNIYISDRAHMVFPYHKRFDALLEEARGEEGIGTTKKGIGPCYMDKVERTGIRICDIFDAAVFKKKLTGQIRAKNALFVKIFGAQPLDEADIIEKYMAYAQDLKPFVRDTSVMVYDYMTSGKKVLFEGAQGSMLDVDLGTYPYVTSSHPTSGGFTTGAGIGSGLVSEIIGITKAYTTRVGMGPFATELDDANGNLIRERGHEYGTTTGRARRCGWFDAVVVKYTARINGTNGLALMLLDVLDEFPEIKICTEYEIDGKKTVHYPASLIELEKCRPVYKILPGWQTDISGCRTYEDLPEETKKYIEAIEELTGVNVKIISVGPDREQTIIREDVF